jgi:2-polyprenyl-3-methyl-5-hydroxy-6-metoxy-1,4-benzoquinol methylase
MPIWNELFKNEELIIKEPNNNFVKYFEKLEKENKIKKIIDLGCGTGRHVSYLARKGYEIHGIDSSQNALNYIKDNIGANDKIELFKIDLLNLTLKIKERYDLGICINVLNHGLFNELEQMFIEIEKVINDDGFLFLILSPEKFIDYVRTSSTQEVEKNSYLYINSPDGDIIHHFYTDYEIGQLLRNFKEVSIKRVLEYSPFLKKEVEHLMIMARK